MQASTAPKQATASGGTAAVRSAAAGAAAGSVAADELTLELGALLQYLLTSTGREVFQAIDDLGLSLSQVKALGVLGAAEEPLPLGALGERLALSLPAISRAVDGLVKRGFVKRTEDPLDRRSKRIRLTAKGRHAWESFAALRLAGLREFVERLEPAEREALARGLRPIARRTEIAAHMPRR